MSVQRGLFSSARTDWETPPELFELMFREFRFALDVCATARNHKCRRYFTPNDDGLRQPWCGRCWMNPPYGRTVGTWIRKAYKESLKGATVVALLPARTDTAWWHNYAMKASEIRLLRGRLTFVGAPSPAPFPSAVVIFMRKPTRRAAPHVVSWDWRVAART